MGPDAEVARSLGVGVGLAGSFLSPLAFWAYVNFLVVPREIRYMKDKFGDEYVRFAKKCVAPVPRPPHRMTACARNGAVPRAGWPLALPVGKKTVGRGLGAYSERPPPVCLCGRFTFNPLLFQFQ